MTQARDDAELWLRECQRVSREVQRLEPSLERMKKLGSSALLASAYFQSALVSRVLHDPAHARFPPNQFQAARFWIALVAAIRAEMESAAAGSSTEAAKLHPELAVKEAESRALIDSDTEEDVFSGWYRNYTLASVCDARTTSTLDGPTGSIIVLPTATAEQDGTGSSGVSPTEGQGVTGSIAPAAAQAVTGSSGVLPEAESEQVGQRVYPFRVETGCLASSIGLVMWPAGFLFCEFALDFPEIFRGRRVLELGSGIGLTATILATFTQPAAIVATDFDVRALQNIHHNFECNGLLPKDTPFVKPADSNPATYTSSGVSPAPLSPFPTAAAAASSAAASSSASSSSSAAALAGRCEVSTACVDWYSFDPEQLRAFDAEIIIACDTTYVSEILSPFARTVRAALEARPNSLCFLAQAERHPSTFMLYLDTLREEGLALQELPTADLHKRFNFDRTTTPVALHRVTLAKSKAA